MKRNLGSVRQSLLHVGVASSVLLASGLATTGCLDRELRPLVPCVSQGFVESIAQDAVEKVDLLMMIDNSGSMSEEQASLGQELPRLIKVLTSGDRTPDDGITNMDFPPVKDLHVGIITSDMGSFGFGVPTCATMYGDDGLLRTRGVTARPGCQAMYPTFLGYQPETATQTPDQFAGDVACVALMGITGCGFEQQLEATLKAVTPGLPGVSPIEFLGGTRGHGDGANAGFLREDSVIALLLFTDEEDCSITPDGVGIFDTGSPEYVGDLNVRCFLYKNAQHPVQRYIDGFKALRPGRESLLVFGAITGVPPDLIPAMGGTPDYAAILADPRMREAIDPGAVSRLMPSCNVPGRGTAFPPRRIVQTAEGFGANGIIQSICQDSYTAALDAIIAKIANALGGVCLPRKLNPDQSGLVGCDVIAVVPAPGTGTEGAPTSCAELGGIDTRTQPRVNADGSIQCAMLQLSTIDIVPPAMPPGQGWYYENLDTAVGVPCAGRQRIAFTAGAVPPNGVTVKLECLQRVQGSGGGNTTEIEIGTPCMPASDICLTAANMTLKCEPVSRSCQVPCTTDANCPSSLVCSFCGNGTCDADENSDSCAGDCDPGVIGSGTADGYCLNPICVDSRT